jgi:hypothetical protein
MGGMELVSEYSPVHTTEIEARYAGKVISDYKRTQPVFHYLAAKPSENAKEITVVITSRFGKVWKETIQLQKN